MSDSCQISFQIHALRITKHPYRHLLFPLDPAFFLSEFLWMIFPAIASYLSATYCTVEMGEAYGVSSKCMQCTHRPRQIYRCSPSPRSERTAESSFFESVFLRVSRAGLEAQACSQAHDGESREWCLNALYFCCLIQLT